MRKNDNIRKPRIFDFKIAENIASKKQIEQICKLNHDYDLLSHQYKLSIQLENFINRDYFLDMIAVTYQLHKFINTNILMDTGRLGDMWML